ncbi:hypothetical protein [Micromonospora chalcea]|uniref:hypothetical protein n=1 Tax=Micromonospora chalcea TaxID=1874 RepID=UPI003D738148
MPLPDWTGWVSLMGVSGLLGGALTGAFDRWNLKLTGRQQSQRQRLELAGQGDRQKLELDGLRERQKLDLEGQRERQQVDHRHQQAMLQQQAHFEARKEAAELAGNALAWIYYEAVEKYGLDHDMFPAHLPSGEHADVGDVIRDLRKLHATHPTKAVRERAARLAENLEVDYNTINVKDGDMNEPTLAEMLARQKDLEALIEVINEPPGTDSQG